MEESLEMLLMLKRAGCQKVTFGGGEPTLHPDIGAMLKYAKAIGLVTALVTNGYRLDRLLNSQPESIDWVALSAESFNEETERKLGRGNSSYVNRTVTMARKCHALGIKVKINSVITSLNYQEDLTPLIRETQPVRWKVFQVLAMPGQNDKDVADLLITPAQFQDFLDRHRHLQAETDMVQVPEDNNAMLDSYLLIDPMGRFFSSGTDRSTVSQPILEVGVQEAMGQVGFREDKFQARGGAYNW